MMRKNTNLNEILDIQLYITFNYNLDSVIGRFNCHSIYRYIYKV